MSHYVGDRCPGGHRTKYKIYDAFGRVWPLDYVLQGVGPGWGQIVQRLIRDLFELGWDGELHQIKEKFGELRFYIGGASDEIFKRVDEASDESLRTCEGCGEPGTRSTDSYWITTECAECHAKARARRDF